MELWQKIVDDYSLVSADAPEALFNIGRVQESQGDTAAALETYKSIGADFPREQVDGYLQKPHTCYREPVSNQHPVPCRDDRTDPADMIFRRESPLSPSRQGVFLARSRLFRGAFSPPVFSLILGFLIYVVFFGLSLLDVFDRPERLISDAHFGIKTFFSSTSNRGIQEGVINDSKSAKISRDIVIVGIEEQTLATFGRWPFPRDTHAGLLQTMSRISDPNNRESAVLLDFLFFDVGDRAYDDVILLDAMSENGNVVLQTQLYNVPIHQGGGYGQPPAGYTDQYSR